MNLLRASQYKTEHFKTFQEVQRVLNEYKNKGIATRWGGDQEEGFFVSTYDNSKPQAEDTKK